MSVILVTGGAGFIGSHTCAELLEHGHEVVVIDDHSNSSAAALDAVRNLTGCPVSSYHADVRDQGAVSRILARHAIDTVIHFAAKKSVPESVGIPLDYYLINVCGTVSLLAAMRERSVRRLVFSSSCSLYGDQYRDPIVEDDPPAPTNPYARTKLICEQLLADACAADPGLSVISLRYFNPVGAHPSAALGEVPCGKPGNVMPNLTAVASGASPELLIYGGDYPTPDGTAVRDYIHVMDVAEAHRVALAHLDDQRGWRVLNIGTGSGLSVRQLVDAFGESCGVIIPFRIIGRRAGDPASLTANAGRVERQWGWRASRNVSQMCADSWRFRLAHPAGYATPARNDSPVRHGG